MTLILPTIQEPSAADMKILKRIDEGLDLHANGDIWAAEKVYRRVLKDHPGHPRATALIGLLHHIRGEHARAVALLEQASTDSPNDAFVHGNRGAVLHSLGRLRDAAEAYTRSVEAWPGYAIGYANLAVVLAELMRQEEAAYAVTRAVDLDPDHYDYGYLRPYLLDLTASTTPEIALEARRRFNDQHVAPRLVGAAPHPNDRTPGRKLKVGYISSDFYQHSAIHGVGGLLLNHDPERVDVTLYGSVEVPDDITEQLRKKFRYVDVNGWSEDRLALAVLRDRVDIAVDLSGFTKGNHLRAFARKPAPIIVSGWGYGVGISVDSHDYLMTDATLVPSGDEQYHHERMLRLPCCLSWAPPGYQVDVGHVAAVFGRPFTFGAYNRAQKLSRPCLSTWAEILRRAPESRLVIKNPGIEQPQLRQELKDAFVAEGVYYAEGPPDTQGRRPTRVALFGKTSHADQMAAHWPIDVMLDPFPMSGGISTFETLWMGLPLVTLYGATTAGRSTASILKLLGLDDWVTRDREAYVARAVRATQAIDALIPLRRELRDRLLASPACKLRAYASTVEDAYAEAWGRWLAETRRAAA